MKQTCESGIFPFYLSILTEIRLPNAQVVKTLETVAQESQIIMGKIINLKTHGALSIISQFS